MDTVFYVISKLVWAGIRPESWIFLWLLWIVVEPSRRKTFGLICVLLILGFIPIGDLLMRPLEQAQARFKLGADEIAGIIVLGGAEDGIMSAEWGQPALNNSAERLTHTMKVASLFADIPIIVTGGSTGVDSPEQAGAYVMKQVLVDGGVTSDRIIVEPNARNTYENVLFSKPLANPDDETAWILITSAFHMPRAAAVFEKQDWYVIASHADFNTGSLENRIRWNFAQHLDQLNVATKEWVGIFAYWLTGRAVWPVYFW